jgi:hypothetical protein
MQADLLFLLALEITRAILETRGQPEPSLAEIATIKPRVLAELREAA